MPARGRDDAGLGSYREWNRKSIGVRIGVRIVCCAANEKAFWIWIRSPRTALPSVLCVKRKFHRWSYDPPRKKVAAPRHRADQELRIIVKRLANFTDALGDGFVSNRPNSLVVPKNNRTQFPHRRLAHPDYRSFWRQDLLLNVGCQVQRVHHLRDPRSRDLAQASQIVVLLYCAVLSHDGDRAQRRKEGYAGDGTIADTMRYACRRRLEASAAAEKTAQSL
jgi:hypothetical protein